MCVYSCVLCSKLGHKYLNGIKWKGFYIPKSNVLAHIYLCKRVAAAMAQWVRTSSDRRIPALILCSQCVEVSLGETLIAKLLLMLHQQQLNTCAWFLNFKLRWYYTSKRVWKSLKLLKVSTAFVRIIQKLQDVLQQNLLGGWGMGRGIIYHH